MRAAHLLTPPAVPARSAPHRPGLALLWARLRAFSLDRDLREGAPTWQSPTHAVRSLQLTSDRRRRRLARSLERLLEAAEQPRALFSGAVVPPRRDQVRGAKPVIGEIVERLRCPGPVAAKGMVMLRDLLADGSGPCYAKIRPDALNCQLLVVSEMLDVPV